MKIKRTIVLSASIIPERAERVLMKDRNQQFSH